MVGVELIKMVQRVVEPLGAEVNVRERASIRDLRDSNVKIIIALKKSAFMMLTERSKSIGRDHSHSASKSEVLVVEQSSYCRKLKACA